MNTILLLGGGKSATYLIDYLSDTCVLKGRKLIVADIHLELVEEKLKNKAETSARSLDLNNEASRIKLIQEADVVISMLPAFMHPTIAKDCLKFKKHFFSASYESKEMREMRKEIINSGLFFLNECGLDPRSEERR